MIIKRVEFKAGYKKIDRNGRQKTFTKLLYLPLMKLQNCQDVKIQHGWNKMDLETYNRGLNL